MAATVPAGVPVTVSLSGYDDPITEALTPLDTRLNQYLNAQGLTVLSLADGPGGFSILSTAITWTATLVVSSPNQTDTDSLSTSIAAAIQNATGYQATSVSVTSVQSVSTGNPTAATPSTNIVQQSSGLLSSLLGGTTTLANALPLLIIGAVVLIGVIVYKQQGTVTKAASASLFG